MSLLNRASSLKYVLNQRVGHIVVRESQGGRWVSITATSVPEMSHSVEKKPESVIDILVKSMPNVAVL